MGITQQYLRWLPSEAPFGIIGSPNGQAVYIELNGVKNRYIASSAAENIIVWDTRTGEKIKCLNGDKSESVIIKSHENLLASGYTDGSMRVFDINTCELKVVFSGHKSSVSCLCFDQTGMRIASGGKDTDIVIWDVVSEAGLFRLKGHKHVVTQVKFISVSDTQDILISSSRDTFVKFWHLETQHCFKTLVGHRTEIWDFVYVPFKNWLITGTADSELRVWKLSFDREDAEDTLSKYSVHQDDEQQDRDDQKTSDESFLSCMKIGSILRKSTTPVRCLTMDQKERILVCHGKDSLIEPFKIRTEDGSVESMKRRLKREKKRAKKRTSSDHNQGDGDIQTDDDPLITNERCLSDDIDSIQPVKSSCKMKHCHVSSGDQTSYYLSVLTVSNMIDVYTFDEKIPNTTFEVKTCLKLEGHRTDVRSLCFSSDNYFILSASADCVKVWSRSSRRCIMTISDDQCGYSLCSLFAPGDKNLLVGTKEGLIHIYDVTSASRIETIRASDSNEAIWTLDMYPDRKGLVTGSEDKKIKFWDFELLSHDAASGHETTGYPVTHQKRLTISHKRTLEMDESILCVKISPNFKFIAASLLDSTVKVFFYDSLKFFLNLYGHKFPVVTMDISFDSSIIVTGGSDKNLKIWGLDFGDCHKSIFAHEDSITNVHFVPSTHYVFSTSKDKTIKQWDTDIFEKIQTLHGHQAEIWSSCLSPNGKYLITSSHDRTLRLWEKSSEPLILEEEREDEREELFEKEIMTADGDYEPLAGETNPETGLSSKKTSTSVRSTELLLESIEVHKSESDKLIAYKRALEKWESSLDEGDLSKSSKPQRPEPHPLLSKFNTEDPDRYFLESLKRIKSSEMEDALISLPFHHVIQLITILSSLLKKNWEIELINRCIFFLCRIHFGQITSTSELLPVLDELRKLSLDKTAQLKDVLGLNLAGLRYLSGKINEREDVCIFRESYQKVQENQKKKKRKSKQGVSTDSVPVLKLT